MSRRTLVAAALTAALARGAAAQTAPATPAGPLGVPTPAGTLVVAAGTDLFSFDNVLGRYVHGAAAQLGYERRLGGPASPFALRLSGEYWSSGGQLLQYAEYGVPGPRPGLSYPYTRRTSLAGGGLFGVWRFAALGPVRAYALAGGGVYQYHASNRYQIPGGPEAIYHPERERATATALGYGGGLGADVRVGRVNPFAEVRAMGLPGLEKADAATSHSALTFGARVRF